MHLVAVGALTLREVEVEGHRFGRAMTVSSVELSLVPGRTVAHHDTHAPYVIRGRIEGLTKPDRRLLEILFDQIAHGPVLSLAHLQHFMSAHPLEYWRYLRDWRAELAVFAATQRVDEGQLRAVRKDTEAALGHLTDCATQAATLAMAEGLGLERKMRSVIGPTPEIAGTLRPLFEATSSGKPPLVSLRSALSPRYPFGLTPPGRIGFTPLPLQARGLVVIANKQY